MKEVYTSFVNFRNVKDRTKQVCFIPLFIQFKIKTKTWKRKPNDLSSSHFTFNGSSTKPHEIYITDRSIKVLTSCQFSNLIKERTKP